MPTDPTPGPGPVPDVYAILAGLQDQIDNLTAAIAAQQRTLTDGPRTHRPGPGLPDQHPRRRG